MNLLAGSIFYLSGPIDCVKSSADAVDWRVDMTRFLHSIGAGVFNPLDKPFNTTEESYVKTQERYRMKRCGFFDDVRDIMKTVCSDDMRLVDMSNAVILYIDKDVHMCGSYIETAWAALEKKPIIVMCKQGKIEVPDFLMGITPHRMFFGSWLDVKDYITSVDCGLETDTMKRWRFVNSGKVFGPSSSRGQPGIGFRI